MSIRNYFIKRKIAKLAQHTGRKKVFRSWKEINRVIIFYDLSDRNEVNFCVSALKEAEKEVLLCTYGTDRPDVKNDSDLSLTVSSKTDLDLFGIPLPSTIKVLNDFSPDILIDLTSRVSYTMQFLFLSCICDFKTGIKKNDMNQYGFAISVTDHTDINYLFKQIIFYLQCIRTK